MLNVLKRLSSNYFGTISVLFFLLFATILCLHSVKNAKREYGDEWQFSVYKNNPFQLDIATKVQYSIHQWFIQQGITGDEGAIIEAITIGYKANISKETKNTFSKAGVSHILALSGFHIGIIYIILQFIFLSKIGPFKWQLASHFIVIICLWIYGFIAGMSPSLIRAVIMCTVLAISKLHTNKFLSIRALAVAAIILFLIEPLIIFHIGFQLSFLSMLGINVIGKHFCNLYAGYTFIDRFVWCTTIITITCTFFTLPIVAYNFGRIPLLSIFSNLIVTTLTYILFLLFFLWAISFGAPIFGSYLQQVSHDILTVTNHIAELPHSSIEWHPTILTIIIYYCLLGIFIICMRRATETKEIT